MKQIGKRVMALGLALALILALAACGAKTPQQVLRTAEEKLEKCGSARYEMTTDLSMSIMDEQVDLRMSGSGAYTRDPEAVAVSLTMDMGELGAVEMQAYTLAADGAYDVYTGMMMDGMDPYWEYQRSDLTEEIEQINVEEAMSLYLESSESFQEAATETVGDSEAVRYDGVISKEFTQKVMEASGVIGDLGGLLQTSEGELDLESIQDELPALPISIWIDSESGLPVQYSMDMTEIMTAVMEAAFSSDPSLSDVSITMEKVTVTATLYDFDAVDEIVVPEEALSAKS